MFEMFPSEAYEYEEEWDNEPVRDIVFSAAFWRVSAPRGDVREDLG